MSGAINRRVRLAMLPMLNRIAGVRIALEAQRDALDRDPGENRLRISIDGTALDGAAAALVRPVLRREIEARIASLDKDLEAMGVEVG